MNLDVNDHVMSNQGDCSTACSFKGVRNCLCLERQDIAEWNSHNGHHVHVMPPAAQVHFTHVEAADFDDVA